MKTVEKALLSLLEGKWVRRADIFDAMRNRSSYTLVAGHLAEFLAKGKIWRRLDANGYTMEPVYTAVREAGGMIIPRRDRPIGVSCPCCGASPAHWDVSGHLPPALADRLQTR